MSLISILGRFQFPASVQKTLGVLNQEGAVSVMPLEGSVLVGRTSSAAKRTGFLELQERLFEETSVAVVWLWGIKMLSGLFSKLKKQFPSVSHLDDEIAWDLPGRRVRHVDLTAMERYTSNADEARRLLLMKSGRLAFSIVMGVSIIGFLIPWANKAKTNWILRYQAQKKKAEEKASNPREAVGPLPLKPPAVSAPVPAPANSQIPSVGMSATHGINTEAERVPFSQPPWLAGTTPQQTVSTQKVPRLPSASFSPAAAGAFSYSPARPTAPVFGLLNPAPVVQALGHGVEQTANGSLFAMDLPLTSGRVVEYGKRSPYEGMEIGFRDTVSVYFYIVFVPQMMRALNRISNRFFNTGLLLEAQASKQGAFALLEQLVLRQPEMAAALKRMAADKPEMARALSTLARQEDPHYFANMVRNSPELSALLSRMRIPGEAIHQALYGSANPALNSAVLREALAKQMTEAPLKPFITMLNRELAVLGLSRISPEAVLGNLKKAEALSTSDLSRILKRIDAGHLPGQQHVAGLPALSKLELNDLRLAVKQAFRHTVGSQVRGASQDLLKDVPVLRPLLSELSEAERHSLNGRLQSMMAQDSRNMANSMFRRNINLTRLLLQQKNGELSERTQQAADWLEMATARRKPVASVVNEELGLLKPQAEALLKKLSPIRQKTAHQQVQQAILQMESTAADDVAEALRTLLAHQKANLSFTGKIRQLTASGLTKSVSFEERASRLLSIHSLQQFLQAQGVHVPAPLSSSPLAGMAEENLVGTLNWMGRRLGEVPRMADDIRLAHFNDLTQQITRIVRGEQLHLATVNLPGDAVHKAEELLQGGLTRDTDFLMREMRTLGHLVEDGRKFRNMRTRQLLKKNLDTFWQSLIRHQRWTPASQEMGDRFLQKLIEGTRIAQNGHLMARIVATLGAMAGLGILVPKLQYMLTRKVTGHDEHPGLARLQAAMKGSSQEPLPDESTRLTRRPFPMFQTNAFSQTAQATPAALT
ncbi:MAG: hypothetical protein AB7P76_08570 [Candidatus Melainabacteria bacterium]